MRIKILHIVLSLETGGLENGIINLINASDVNQFKVDVLCLRAKGELVKRISNTETVVYFDGDSDESIIKAVKKVKNICKANKYDILHTHGWTTMLVGYIGRILTKVPYIINGEHGTIYSKSLKQKLAQKFLFSQMSKNLTVSEDLMKKLSKEFNLPENRFQPILNGVNSDRFYPDSKKGSMSRDALGIKSDVFVLGAVGRLVPVKNYPCLIKAFHQFKDVVRNSKLVIIGEGQERYKIESLITKLKLENDVILLGRRDDTADLYNAFDLFVLSSFREGLSNTILEALASGLPVIASRVGGNTELIKTGVNGYLFEVNNHAELLEYLLRIYNNKHKIELMSLAARELIEKNFSINSMVDKYEATYRQLAKKNN